MQLSVKGQDGNSGMCRSLLAVPCMMAIITIADNHYVEINKYFERNTGYRRDELAGHSVTECGEFLSFQDTMTLKESLLKEGFVSNREVIYRTKKGAVHHGLLSADVIQVDGISCMLLVINDRAEQSRMEAVYAEESRAILQSVIESLPFEFFAIGADGRYFLQNGVSKSMWGDIRGKMPRDIAPDPYTDTLWQDNNRRAFQGEMVRCDVAFSVPEGEKHFHNIIGPIRNAGSIIGISGINIDISERKKVELELRESEEKYRSLVEDINEVVYTLDEKARITYISPNTSVLGGYDESELLGRPFTDFVYKADIVGRIGQFKKVIAGVNEATEYRMVTKSGDVYWVRTAARPIVKNGVVRGIRGVLMDITERKAAEERREELERQLLYARKMEAVGALAGGVAHDLNNVLTGLVSLPELILSQIPEESPLRSFLRTVKKSGEKAAAMVEDLLTMARRGVAVDSVVDLNGVIEEYLETTEYELLKAHHPHVCFEISLDRNLKGIQGSPVHL